MYGVESEWKQYDIPEPTRGPPATGLLNVVSVSRGSTNNGARALIKERMGAWNDQYTEEIRDNTAADKKLGIDLPT